MVQKYRFGKERYIKQINNIWEWQKITGEPGGKWSCLKSIRDTREERGGSNGKSNVIVNNPRKLFFVFKLSGLNGYLKGYLMSMINKLPKKINQ